MGWRDGEWGGEIGSGWRDGDLICYSFLCSYVHMATYILHCSNK